MSYLFIYRAQHLLITHPHPFTDTLKPCTVGKSFVGMRYKLLNPDANGEGEVATYGRNVFMGYIWEEKKTKEALTDDGEFWMKSGDIGR